MDTNTHSTQEELYTTIRNRWRGLHWFPTVEFPLCHIKLNGQKPEWSQTGREGGRSGWGLEKYVRPWPLRSHNYDRVSFVSEPPQSALYEIARDRKRER